MQHFHAPPPGGGGTGGPAVPGRNPGLWSLADDQTVWNSLGELPRGKGGGVSAKAPGVEELAERFGRTKGGIVSRLKHLDDPSHAAYTRLHGLPPPAKRIRAEERPPPAGLPASAQMARGNPPPSPSAKHDFEIPASAQAASDVQPSREPPAQV